MRGGRNPFSGKRRYLYGLVLLMAVFAIFLAFNMPGSDDFYMARKEVLFRRIGHELLLQSGDSTSRVLPVKKVAAGEYQIRFENEFAFKSDSLVNITRRLLVEDSLARDYVVNVLNGDGSVAFGYAISKNEKDNILACSGRTQPKADYKINIKFKTTGANKAMNGYLLGSLSLPFLAFLGFIVFSSVKQRRNALPESPGTTSKFTFGPVLFDAEQRQLTIHEKTMELTRTEARLLHIFAECPNEIIERSRLQKEIWEDEGVIVGRSLDMFISKLRKKLEVEPNINIVVVRGKGYKFETSYQ